ncbi:MAG TPA: undecaprenyl-diphosphate phosphatase [Desulfobacteria bacterium]|nr:undecaprenyl-diphosphate phosphatase [Desulfobacteria bacterium]
MESYLVAVIQGIVEGLTEFLPVSSTGHLILSGNLLGFSGDVASTFEVVIQLGAILAIAILYRKRVLSLFALAPRKANGLSLLHILVAMIPASVVGLATHKFIKHYLFSPKTVLLGLVVGGLFMIFAERIGKRVTAGNLDQITIPQAFGIGVAQCLSLWPGFSRAGATISGGLIAGLDRKTAAEFSFLVAIPIMVAASGLDLLSAIKDHLLHAADLGFFAVGFVISFVVAWLAVVWFLKLLERVKLTPFAIYRFIVALVYGGLLLTGIVK